MAYLIWSYSRDRFGVRDLVSSALLVLALLLAMFTLRSATALAYYRADDGTELLARNVPTQGVEAFVSQVSRLSRDLSVESLSNIDNTGTFSVNIAISPDVEWPFAWYFRDYPNMRVTGPAGWNTDDDIVIAMTPEGMDTAGFVVQPPMLTSISMGALSSATSFRWMTGMRASGTSCSGRWNRSNRRPPYRLAMPSG
jgi:hypothetical protein